MAHQRHRTRVAAQTTQLGEAEVDIVTESQSARNETPEEQAKREKDEKVLALARKRFSTSRQAFSFFREEAQADAKFRAGTWGKQSYQWPAEIQAAREADQRPVMTINRMPGFIRQVTNTQRQANLRIRVKPVDDKGDPKLAEVLGGIIRNIETQSFADRAYTKAGDKQAEIGLGFITITREWADQKSFRKRIRLERCTNPLAIYVDPNYKQADFHDGNYQFEVSDIDASEYETVTGKKEAPQAASLEAFEGGGDQTGEWFPNGKIRIVKYYSREPKGPRVRKALLSDGKIINYPNDEQLAQLQGLGITIKQDRWVQEMQIVVRKMDALTIHEESVWPADGFPHTPVLGDELEIDGVKDFRGIVRDSKEGGRAYNVQVTSLIELIGMGQRAPVMGVKGQFGAPNTPTRKAWEQANKKPLAFLEYENVTIDDKPAAPPQRVQFSPDLAGVLLAIKQTDEDYKSLAGFRDASLGERGPQESGKAILARQRQDELGSSHYLDNLRFALCSVGRQLIQLIRVDYDEPTVVRITGDDERQKSVMVFSGQERDPRNEQFLETDPVTGQRIPYQLPDGVKEIYDLSVGEFDVEVAATPDTGSRREEAVEAMTKLFTAVPPEVAMKFLDLYFLVMDFPMARQMANRAKKLMPADMQDDEEGGSQEIPPQAQQQIMQMQQEMQQAIALVDQLQKAIETEQVKMEGQLQLKREELEAKERIEAMKHRAAMVMEQVRLKGEKAIAEIEAELERIAREDEQRHELRLKNLDHAEHVDDRKHEIRKNVIDKVLTPKPEKKPAGKAGPKK